jgi:hypothetical protein
MAPRSPGDIGTHTETDVVRYLQGAGFPQAERRRLRGRDDAGDITGTPGICWSVKGGAAAKTASDLDICRWLHDLEQQRINAAADLGVLVTQRRGVGPANAGRWWAWLDGRHWLDSRIAGPLPLRLHLGDAVSLLRIEGYGDPHHYPVITAEVSP